MKKKLALIGASGRMGRELLAQLGEATDFELVAALVSERSHSIGAATGILGVNYQPYRAESLLAAECVIDFSSPALTAQVASDCGKRALPLLIGTTGIDERGLELVAEAATQAPILLAPNTSMGIAALSELASFAQKILGPGFDIELSEIHHRDKKDAPSGTAKSLAARLIREGSLQEAFNREGKREPGELGISSLRGGGVYGEHSIYFLGNGERIVLTHQAENRTIFARGAYSLLQSLVTLRPGLYTVSDLVGKL